MTPANKEHQKVSGLGRVWSPGKEKKNEAKPAGLSAPAGKVEQLKMAQGSRIITNPQKIRKKANA